MSISISTGVDFKAVAVHEIGHAIGITHSDKRNTIMYPSYTGGSDGTLAFDDINVVQTLYGKPKLPEIPSVPVTTEVAANSAPERAISIPSSTTEQERKKERRELRNDRRNIINSFEQNSRTENNGVVRKQYKSVERQTSQVEMKTQSGNGPPVTVMSRNHDVETTRELLPTGQIKEVRIINGESDSTRALVNSPRVSSIPTRSELGPIQSLSDSTRSVSDPSPVDPSTVEPPLPQQTTVSTNELESNSDSSEVESAGSNVDGVDEDIDIIRNVDPLGDQNEEVVTAAATAIGFNTNALSSVSEVFDLPSRSNSDQWLGSMAIMPQKRFAIIGKTNGVELVDTKANTPMSRSEGG